MAQNGNILTNTPSLPPSLPPSILTFLPPQPFSLCSSNTDPRYARINTLKATKAMVLHALAHGTTDGTPSPRQLMANSAAAAVVGTGSRSGTGKMECETMEDAGVNEAIARCKADEQTAGSGAQSGGSSSSSGGARESNGHGRVTAVAYAVKEDEWLDDVLVFPPGTDLHAHPLVTTGQLILQVGIPPWDVAWDSWHKELQCVTS